MEQERLWLTPGEWIRHERKLRDWSQSKLAEVMGVSQPMVSRIETTTRYLHEPSARLLARAFNIPEERALTYVRKPSYHKRVNMAERREKKLDPMLSLMREIADGLSLSARQLHGLADDVEKTIKMNEVLNQLLTKHVNIDPETRQIVHNDE